MNDKIEKANLAKILKTVRGSVKKAIFYLGADLSYENSIILVYPLRLSLATIKKDYPLIYKLILLDYYIRETDDKLDEYLYRQIPVPVKEIKNQIKNLSSKSTDFKTVTDLFHLELRLKMERIADIKVLKSMILHMIELRPCDYFLLVDKIISFFGSKLSKQDLTYSKCFFIEFQKIRDLLDDIMSTEEDLIKNSYNNILIGEKYNLSHDFFNKIILDKFKNLSKNAKLVKDKRHRRLLESTIIFWKKQYEILFCPLLTNYFLDKEKYKEIYFMFKQI